MIVVAGGWVVRRLGWPAASAARSTRVYAGRPQSEKNPRCNPHIEGRLGAAVGYGQYPPFRPVMTGFHPGLKNHISRDSQLFMTNHKDSARRVDCGRSVFAALLQDNDRSGTGAGRHGAGGIKGSFHNRQQ